jgi:hypothetical protein
MSMDQESCGAASGRASWLAVLVAALALVLLAPTAGAGEGPPVDLHGSLQVVSISGPPQYVSGGAVRIRVVVPAATSPAGVKVTLNGLDVTQSFAPVDVGGHALEGVLTGLPLGESTVAVSVPGDRASLTLTNYPIAGPMFSGPHQALFLCASSGDRAKAELGPALDADCGTATVVSFKYRTTGGQWKPYDPTADRPADMAQTTTSDGRSVDFIVRWERGTINRFIYSIAMLSPDSQDVATPDLSAWNRKAIFYFEGGVGIGHYQGGPNQSQMLYPFGLGQGYAVLYSTGNKTGVHYNLELGGETAIMVKSRFVTAYDDPLYTIGLGGSGGAIQQYVYAQNHPGLIDGAVPQYSYPDMVTQTIHIGDCELLERWMDSKVLANPASPWRTWTNRSLLEGLNASSTVPNPFAALMPYMPAPGSDECINGWRGLSPLVLNPHYGTAPGITPEQQAATEWTHWADLVNIYGTDATGFARSPWDNVGVQYGLQALRDGSLTPAEFLDLNANVGSWKEPKDMIQEGCPFISTACLTGDIDVWSARNMNLSPDGGATPAPRREGDLEAMHAAYRSGMVFGGRIGIPIIDWRHYLEESLNMHNSHQSFASRQRLLNENGDASNQVIWFTDARPAVAFDQTPMAIQLMDEWLANIRTHPALTVAQNKPAGAVDRCFARDGTPIAAGEHVWDGILDNQPAGACTQAFPIHKTSRIVAGSPIEGGIFKCYLKPVEWAIAQGLYGEWNPTKAEVNRLNQIFSTGVCDYSRGDAGRPAGI